MTRPAVFIDRDGTLIADPPPGFVRDPAKVALLPGAGRAVTRFHDAGYAVVVVTNQAGIGRELITWEQYRAVDAMMKELLAAEGATLDGTYMCPHAPEIDGDCPCRKPKPFLYRNACRDLSLDGARSWWIGDRVTDLVPSRAFAGRGVLVRTGLGADHEDAARALGFPVIPNLLALITPDDRLRWPGATDPSATADGPPAG